MQQEERRLPARPPSRATKRVFTNAETKSNGTCSLFASAGGRPASRRHKEPGFCKGVCHFAQGPELGTVLWQDSRLSATVARRLFALRCLGAADDCSEFLRARRPLMISGCALQLWTLSTPLAPFTYHDLLPRLVLQSLQKDTQIPEDASESRATSALPRGQRHRHRLQNEALATPRRPLVHEWLAGGRRRGMAQLSQQYPDGPAHQ
ncbi:uncharacterized protein BKA78DRAFT_297980 [Phyllosticta capitalensis]|uniref:uncharacterized protein n=1 Tax=Phyllosticta capitalensis TaxID=121624 RepID=UPI00312FF7EF